MAAVLVQGLQQAEQDGCCNEDDPMTRQPVSSKPRRQGQGVKSYTAKRYALPNSGIAETTGVIKAAARIKIPYTNARSVSLIGNHLDHD